MKLKLRLKPLPPDSVRVYPESTPHYFLVDRSVARKIRAIRWRFLPKKKRARGYFGRAKVRMYLHRYVLHLAKKYYPEVTFANGDWWDCRLVNLKPYRRDEEGATRRVFKNNTSKRKGVSWHKAKKKWVAMIRTQRRLRHLGYFTDADAAADAYAKAWNLAHPTLTQLPIRGRT